MSVHLFVCLFAGTITFLHWLAGMVYIFYFASFVMLLREVLRPGVLWFLRNLNDQNFHPIQEVSLHCTLCNSLMCLCVCNVHPCVYGWGVGGGGGSCMYMQCVC